jgi:hypothetical protein
MGLHTEVTNSSHTETGWGRAGLSSCLMEAPLSRRWDTIGDKCTQPKAALVKMACSQLLGTTPLVINAHSLRLH